MRSKKNFYALISVVIIVVILISMIVSTVILSTKQSQQWEYISAEDKLNYYATDPNDSDFQYVMNFKASLSEYFSELFNEFLSTYVNLKGYISSIMEKFADRIINAMEQARVSSAKLNKIAQALKSNSVSSIFTSIKDDLMQIESLDELEEYLIKLTENFSIFSLFGDTINGFMDESSLTENEIAEFLYYYLAQNTNETYFSTLKSVGKDFFVSLVSNTIYVLRFFEDAGQNEYLSLTTANSIQAVFYQLGSVYESISKLPGGTVTLEKVFGFDFEYSIDIPESEQLNSYAENVKGKIGEIIVLLGSFMKKMTAEDIQSYITYLSLEDGKEKSDMKIYSAIVMTRIISLYFNDITDVCGGEINNITELAERYASMTSSLTDISFTLVNSEILLEEGQQSSESEDEPINYSTFFTEFANAVNYFSEINLQISDLNSLSAESDEYTELLAQADAFFEIENGFAGIFDNLITVWLSETFISFILEGAENE